MFSVLALLVKCLNTAMMIDVLGKAAARIWDDYKRNRATAQRVAGMEDHRIGLIH